MEVLKRAKEKDIHRPLENDGTDLDLEIILYPKKQIPTDHRRKPGGSIFIKNWLHQE